MLAAALSMTLGGCGNYSITTERLDDIAAERARYLCMAAGVPVKDLPYCITRDVAERRKTQWFGSWSPI